MNTSHVRLPMSQIVSPEEPSARGLNTLCERNVVGQNYNNLVIKQLVGEVCVCVGVFVYPVAVDITKMIGE